MLMGPITCCQHRVLLNASLYKGLSMQQQKAMVLMTLEVADAPGWVMCFCVHGVVMPHLPAWL